MQGTQAINCTHEGRWSNPFFTQQPKLKPIIRVEKPSPFENENTLVTFMLPRKELRLSDNQVIRCTRCGTEKGVK